MTIPAHELPLIDALVASLTDELVEIRRDIHAHPELARAEVRTTRLVADRLRVAGLEPRLLPGTGLVCDIGPGPDVTGRGRIGLRADLDALPVAETTGLGWASTVAGVSHACGHDVHTAAVLGAGLVLAELAQSGSLATGVRLVFQPAEEVQPGGALDVIEAGGIDDVGRIFALHCDPRVDVGHVATRIGPVTSASDEVTVTVSASGGHTSRPHLTGDVVFALGQVVTQVPAVLGRRLDPRSGVNLTWGSIGAGAAHNVIPSSGWVKGTLRCLDVATWHTASEVFAAAVDQVLAPFAVEVDVRVVRGVPPVENEAFATSVVNTAARTAIGADAVVLTEQSLGGEDFAWYLTKVPGAMVRLGTRTPGGRTFDLHQGDFTVDEDAVAVGAKVLAAAAVLAGSGVPIP